MRAFALATLLALAPLAANAVTIDFTTLPGSTNIDQAYGDVAGVLDVVYEYSFDGGANFSQGGYIWAGGYYGFDANTNALIAPAGGASIMQITLNALGGNTFNEVGAGVAYWQGVDAHPLSISFFFDGGGAITTDNTLVPGLTGAGLPGGPWTKAVIQLGPDWFVGYQSVTYNMNTATVPLPAAGFLLLGALGGLGLMRRGRNAA